MTLTVLSGAGEEIDIELGVEYLESLLPDFFGVIAQARKMTDAGIKALDEPEGQALYRRAYEVTLLIQGWSQRERRRPGSATSRFRAAQQASATAR